MLQEMRFTTIKLKHQINMKRIVTLFCITFSSISYAQDTIKVADNNAKKVKFMPLPVIAANPTAGWMFGIVPGA